MLVYSGSPHVKELFWKLPTIWARAFKITCKPCLGTKNFEEYRFEGCQIISLPGAPTGLGPALWDRNVLPLVGTEPTTLERPPCSSQFTVPALNCYSTAGQSQGHTCTCHKTKARVAKVVLVLVTLQHFRHNVVLVTALEHARSNSFRQSTKNV